MAVTISELVERLQELPPDWAVRATKAGGSLEVWQQDGFDYAYVFTDERPIRRLKSSYRGVTIRDKEQP